MSKIKSRVPLKNYSNFRIGGSAKFFIEIESIRELREILKQAKYPKGVQNDNEKIFILGRGTNVLISDEGFDGLVIYNKIRGIERAKNNLTVGSGVLIKDLLDYCIENSLTGLEWAGGLPGTLGGAVRGNAGAFGGEIKDSVAAVSSLAINSLEERIRNNTECQFGYRNSVFKSGEGENEFITHVILELAPGDKNEIREKIQQKMDYRNNRHPMNYPNIGSTFKNIPLDSLSRDLQREFASFVKTDPFPVVPTTKLLALCDLKGKRAGGAMISEKHPNFILNVDSATAEDVKVLISVAKQAIKDKYHILLEEEIVRLD
ncbi:MAG: UDP-N-acetylmuramate dehydrogenase [Candidatus Levybacteria bacterium]|nr:UDP-N-acetylmuramate dehydrogenase [Candidatus Levybacteria bacterium]